MAVVVTPILVAGVENVCASGRSTGYRLIDKVRRYTRFLLRQVADLVTKNRLAEQWPERECVCGAALYSPRSADLPVWGATVEALYMTYT
jgi:hypothetical protein